MFNFAEKKIMVNFVNNKKNKFPSELRFDIVSKHWVVIATGRARRPEAFKQEKHIQEKKSSKDCIFCNIRTQEKPTAIFYNGKKIASLADGSAPKNWSVVSVPNKYPAFMPNNALNKKTQGLYQSMDANGFHEVVITKSHNKQIAQFSIKQIKEVIDVYQERYLDLMNKKFVNYISIFHNHGKEAGASIAHPHSQIIAIPVTDPDIQENIIGAKQFFNKEKKCVYCEMNKQDIENKKRIVFENKEFVAVCSFASKVAFEISISPKNHSAYFEKITENQKIALAEALQAVLRKLYKGLNNPAYNFFLRTAPCDGKNYDFFHWRLNIMPKTSIWAGFELGAGIEISTIEPEKAAEYLRKQ